MAGKASVFVDNTVVYRCAILSSIIVGILQIVGVCTSSWIEDHAGLYMGLWQQCWPEWLDSVTECRSLVTPTRMPSKFVAVQVLELAGTALILITLLGLILQKFVRQKTILLGVGIVAPIGAAVFIWIGAAIFIRLSARMKLAYSFYLSAIAGCLCINLAQLSVLNVIIIRKKEERLRTTPTAQYYDHREGQLSEVPQVFGQQNDGLNMREKDVQEPGSSLPLLGQEKQESI